MIDLIQDLFEKENLELLEASLFKGALCEFVHSTVVDGRGRQIAGGFGKNRHEARKKAVAELIERRFYSDLVEPRSDRSQGWGLETIRTACGFAAGFSKRGAIMRSIGEGVERWVLSKWVDGAKKIDEVEFESSAARHDPASLFFRSHFDRVRIFKKSVFVDFCQNRLSIQIFVCVGFKGEGAFLGMAYKQDQMDGWQHSLLESYRHLNIFRNRFDVSSGFPANRIHFFGRNAKVAEALISRAVDSNWEEPKILLHNVSSVFGGQMFVARTIIDGWTDWSEGEVSRFLY